MGDVALMSSTIGRLQHYLKIALEVLDKDACWDEGEISSEMDTPWIADRAREALAKIRGGDGRP